MPWIKGFNFRDTAAFITGGEGANNTYVVNPSFPEAYPTTRNGVDFGLESGFVQTRDRGVTDPRLSGSWFPDSAVALFRVDLPAAGDYIVRMAIGEGTYGVALTDAIVQVQDGGVSTLFSIDHTTGFSTDTTFRDATDALLTSAAWITAGGGAGRTVTFTTTICRVALGASGRFQGPIAHFSLEQVEAVTPPSGGGGAYDLSIRRTRWRR